MSAIDKKEGAGAVGGADPLEAAQEVERRGSSPHAVARRRDRNPSFPAGFKVFPVGPDKKPLVKWSREATDDHDRIAEWANRFSGCGWGVACKASRLLVLDVDVKNGKRGRWALDCLEVEHGALPATRRADTPSGGLHIYMRGAASGGTDRLGEGLDVKSAEGEHGGYVVLPPSEGYAWVAESPASIAEAPEWLVGLAGQPGSTRQGRSEEPTCELDADYSVERATQYLRSDAPPALQGEGGDERTLKVAMAVGDLGISEAACLELMLDHYNGRCEPPWDPEELAVKVRNAYRYRASAAGSASVASDFADEVPCRHEVPSAEWPTRLAYEHKHGAKNARLFLSRRPARLISSERTLYSFEGGVWREVTDDELAAEVRATDPTDFLDVDHVRKVVAGVHHRTATKARPFGWIQPPAADVALFANGLLDLDSGALLPHDGRYFATALPSHHHDAEAECPTWNRWLHEALDASFHPTLQEFFGLCLTADVRAHKLLCLVGVKRGGKSTCADVLRRLVGPGHSASALLQDLGSDFGLQECLDKRLLLVPDAHDVAARSRAAALERIKSITGGDHVSVNRKNRSIVTAVLPTRIVVAANRLPKFIDESGALAARMLIVRFDRSFEGREDRALGERLAAEMPGIANWALEGLRRLRTNGLRFTVGEAGCREVLEAERSQSPALRFAEARLSVTGDEADFTPMREVYRAYRDWTYDEGLPQSEQRNQTDLYTDIRAAFGDRVRYTQRRLDGRKVNGLAGVAGVPRVPAASRGAQDLDPLA